MPTHTVFYSWQSDLPNTTNRGFIQDALERAAKEIRKDEEFGVDPSIDRDIVGVPGSPNIVAAIFEKIGRADVFVADVSFITPLVYDGRPTPNPNVLIELGYAANRHGWNRILCVFNAATGRVEDLPFDIRQHSITCYSLTEGHDKSEARKMLVAQLRDKIRLILTTPDAAEAKARKDFDWTLFYLLSDVLIFGGECNFQVGGRPIGDVQIRFRAVARDLRRLAADQTAHDLGSDSELIALADKLDVLANTLIHSGMIEWFRVELGQVIAKGGELKAKHFDSKPLSEESIKEVRARLTLTQRELAALAGRAESMIRGRHGDLKEEARELGERLLRIGHYNLDRITPGLGERLQRIGGNLHLVQFVQVTSDPESVERMLMPVRVGDAELTGIVNTLPKGR